MKKIIPFKKQLTFKTNVSEVTSIALENTLKEKNNTIQGDLIISGTYKITETSTKVDDFEFVIPMNIEIDNKYITDDIIIDINDFYYETINNNLLEVNIEIMIDNIIEKEEQKEKAETIPEPLENITIQKEERCIEEEKDDTPEELPKEKNEKQEKNNDIFNNFSEETDEYTTYHVYIVREGDTLETIMAKYETTKDELNQYNDLTEIKLGDKIIIPQKQNAWNKWNIKKIWFAPKKI